MLKRVQILFNDVADKLMERFTVVILRSRAPLKVKKKRSTYMRLRFPSSQSYLPFLIF